MKKEKNEGRDRERCIFFILVGIVFISGFCSLAYQVVWLREFRLIFGGAAPAAAAVLAIFMGGLGLGGLILGKRVDGAVHPGRWYAAIEAGITLMTLLSPILLWLVRELYIMTGGVQTLGLFVATLLQFAMTALVIGPACFMMGGTLPAVLRVAQSDRDTRRSTTAVFYGVNVAGAVSGAFIATFFLLPQVGNLRTLLLAGTANAVIAGLAYVIVRDQKREAKAQDPASEHAQGTKKRKGKSGGTIVQESALVITPPRCFAPAAAFASGFAFFVIELVWYRASIPLFGGSVYNFGLILAVALAGIGSGSLFYSLVLQRFVPSMRWFAIVSGLLAFSIIVPFALGDRLAHAALLLNTFFLPRSFEGLVFGWTMICGVLVFLPAFFSGIQFPFLISLIGSGGDEIGAQVGRVYAWNTLGSVSGALLGGFALIPLLSITGTWRLAALVAVLISLAAMWVHRLQRNPNGARMRRFPIAAVLGLITLWLSFTASGPSAYWLHHPIGYGRANALFGASEADWINYVNQVNRSLVDSKDGRETSVAVTSLNDYAMLSNGKSDSAAIGDSSTTVMSGLIGAILHPKEIKTACVVGFGTGITAGWMEKIESLEKLDVIELERVIIELGRHFKQTNFEVASASKVEILEGDAREILITRPQKYDFITSEPSNLHRAGVANLYTQEFYESVSERLESDGIFCQWVQTYETDLKSIHLVIATLSAVFPKVELWQAGGGDMLLVCAKENEAWDLETVGKRLKQEPYQTGVRNLWGTTTLEGFFARAVANAAYTQKIAANTVQRNTDDLNHLEFWFAQNLGVSSEPLMNLFSREADAQGQLVPEIAGDGIPFSREQWAVEFLWKGLFFDQPHFLPRAPAGTDTWPEDVVKQLEFLERFRGMKPVDQVRDWPLPLSTETSQLYRLSALANTADERFEKEIVSIRETWPTEYHVLQAEYASSRGETTRALNSYLQAIVTAQTQPLIRWGYHFVLWEGLESIIKKVEFTSVEQLSACFDTVAEPLAFSQMSDGQRRILMSLAMPLPLKYQVRAAESWGDYPQWNKQVLEFRRDVFQKASHPQARQAQRDFEQWSESVRRKSLDESTEKKPES